ncbi:MAG: hypothetical protein AB7S48_15985 [Bacteroidales bacterium]
METQPLTSKEYFRGLSIMHFALIAGQVIFGIIAFALGKTISNGFDPTTQQGLLIAVPIFIIGTFIASTIVFRKRVENIKTRSTLNEKMTEYRAALIISYAMLEGGSMFAIVAYILTSNIILLSLSALIIAVMIINKPSIQKAVSDLELNSDDEKKLNNPDSIIS